MYGIDIATYQRNLNIDTVRQQGNEFVGVKSVASYRPELTIAADYQHNIDKVVAAGLKKYHYAVPNSVNDPETTADFQWKIRYRHDPSDLFMLDNEPLDAYRVFWGDALAARYFRRLNSFGVPYYSMMLYCPAALTRAQGRWNEIIALREKGLQIQWVSYGDNDPYYEDGEEPFIGNTGLVDPESHQFTSSYTVPGYNGLLDRVYSRLTVQQMFRGGTPMPRTPAGAFAWAAHEAANGNVLDNWGGWCEKFINNAGAFNQAFGSAEIAGNNSGPLRRDYENAGVGAIVYWGGVGGLGHDAFVYRQGADPVLLMASNAARYPAWGHGIGLITLSGYQAAFGHPLKGWTYRHGTETLDRSGLAGGGGTPIEEDDMFEARDRALLENVAAHLYQGGPDAAKPEYVAGAGSVYNLLKSPVLRSANSAATALPEDGTVVAVHQTQDNADTNSLARRLLTEVTALRAAIAALAIGGGIDPEELERIVNDAVQAGLKEGAPALIAGVDETLKDDFAAVPGAVADEQRERLAE
jgi:hypothetical protein